MSPKLKDDVPSPLKNSLQFKKFPSILASPPSSPPPRSRSGTSSLLMDEIYALSLEFGAWSVAVEVSLAQLLSGVTAVST